MNVYSLSSLLLFFHILLDSVVFTSSKSIGSTMIFFISQENHLSWDNSNGPLVEEFLPHMASSGLTRRTLCHRAGEVVIVVRAWARNSQRGLNSTTNYDATVIPPRSGGALYTGIQLDTRPRTHH